MANYAYIRVSTDKQDLDNQRHGVIEYARKNALEPLHFFEDTASGKKSWRDRDLGKLLNQAQKGDVLLVAEISRLARSTLQVLEVLQEAAKKEIAVHVAKNNMVMDGSLNSRITAVVLGLAAEIEREFISARTTEALARRKAEGKPIGRRKGSKNRNKKLDARADEIKDLLKKGIHKTSIAKIMDCDPETLYRWMYENGLSAYIVSKDGSKAQTKAKKKPKPPQKLWIRRGKRADLGVGGGGVVGVGLDWLDFGQKFINYFNSRFISLRMVWKSSTATLTRLGSTCLF